MTSSKPATPEVAAGRPAVTAVPTPPEAFACCGLPGVDFSDAFSGVTLRSPVTALEAANAAFDEPPPLVAGLMAARNRIVSVFGLKTPESPRDSAGLPQAGIFPILSQTPQELVLGLDDKHLDFRIWVSVRPRPAGEGGGNQVVMATLVRHNHLSGRIYLATIMPFHKLLSRMMLARGLRRLNQSVG